MAVTAERETEKRRNAALDQLFAEFPQRWFWRSDLASLLGVSEMTIAAMFKRGELPPHDSVINDRPRWLRSTVIDWMRRRAAQPVKKQSARGFAKKEAG